MTSGFESSDRGGLGADWMVERLVCRHAHLAMGKWTRKEEEPKYAPDRTCDVEHLRLELEVDLPAHTCHAVCTQRLRAAYGPFRLITLDAWELKIRHVRDDSGRDLPYTYLNKKLTVSFPEPVHDSVQLIIAYTVENPVDGLYFMGPSEYEPDVTWQLWSQNEDEGARHWIPCHDAPNERMTTELVVTAPAENTVISNGALQSVNEHAGKRTWHYKESVPHPSYLISLVVGIYSKLEDRWNNIPVEYFVPPGREDEGRRSFGRTPNMIEFFSTALDFPYPYEKYAQVAVRNFHFGGMENTSATTQTEGTLHDERAALDFTSDELVAHELAHQWFGDLVTCKSWAHAWLNEGFATYFEALWKEHDKGREEFDHAMLGFAAGYLSEPYRRSIVTARYGYPFEMFDAHLYPKGGWVLHMLRRQLGDEIFWKAMRLYLKRHSPGLVETIDLIRAFEDASGKNLTGFFDQWIFSPGHPELEGELTWDGDASWVKLAVKQTQKRDNGAPVFRIPLRLVARAENGTEVDRTFEMDRPDQTFYLPLPSRPAWVVVDPEGAVLRETKIKRPVEWIEAALLGPMRHERVLARVDLVRQLAEDAGGQATEILRRTLLEDPFWGVQAEAAKALAKLRSPAARDALISGLELSHPKARRAVVIALGNWREKTVVDVLRGFVHRGDASYFVQMSALASLGRSGGTGVADELKALLAEALARRDWHDVIALGAVEGLVAARDETAVGVLLALAEDQSRYWLARVGAIKGLGELGAARPKLAPMLAEELVRFLEDPRYLVATRMPEALVALGESSAVAALRRKGDSTPVAVMRESCLCAADDLVAQTKRGEDVDRLRGELEKLQGETKELRETLEGIKQKVMPEKPEAGNGHVFKPAAGSGHVVRPVGSGPLVKPAPRGAAETPGRRSSGSEKHGSRAKAPRTEASATRASRSSRRSVSRSKKKR
jgi:aminopeptidase N